jgi:hypothetical protein
MLGEWRRKSQVLAKPASNGATQAPNLDAGVSASEFTEDGELTPAEAVLPKGLE